MTLSSSLYSPGLVALLALSSSVLLALGGCASAPVPTAQLAVAQAAVDRASNTSTTEVAPTELGVAVGKLASARSAVVAGDNERARRLAIEAAVDAQLAETRAQTVRANKAARDSDEAARALREELNRKTPR